MANFGSSKQQLIEYLLSRAGKASVQENLAGFARERRTQATDETSATVDLPHSSDRPSARSTRVAAERCVGSSIPDNLDVLLTRRQLGVALTAVASMQVASGTMAFQTPPSAFVEAPVGPLAVSEPVAQQTEILWDKFGVPHVFAADDVSLANAFGWCQAHSHGNLLLRLLGRARARAAEYWGAGQQDWQLESDRRVLRLGVPARAKQWYDANYQSARAILDAFAAGINDYGTKHRDNLDSEVLQVLPVSGVDILAHLQVVIHFHFVFQPDTFFQRGSNGWAIAQSKSATGNAMLLVNPHTPWADLYTWFEAHLIAERVGMNFYGATFVGLPLLCVGFNRNLGWTHTVNTMNGADTYGLRPLLDGYAWDNADGKLPYETTEHTIRVKQQDGSFVDEHLVVRSSIHGPIIIEDAQTPISLRVVGLHQPFICAQYWDMMRATNLTEFEAAIRHLQNPIFMVIYADRNGHIMSLFGGRNPKKAEGDWNFWLGLVPGWESRYLWTETYAYDDLPKVVDPSAGWVQNANDPPWWTTLPSPLDPTRYPPSFALRSLQLRPQHSIRMLQRNPILTLDGMAALKLDTIVPLAERILDDLLTAARQQKGDLIEAAVKVLERWDRKTDTGSRGAVLFAAWAALMPWDTEGFAEQWSETELLTTPKGLRSSIVAVSKLELAAQQLVNDYSAIADDPGVALMLDRRFRALAVPWGEIFRLRRDTVDLPSNGASDALGVFRTVEYEPIAGSAPPRFEAVSGDSFVAAVEFSDPPRALVLLGYGNSSQPGSPHRADQLELMSRGELRQAWIARSDIEANLERREQI